MRPLTWLVAPVLGLMLAACSGSATEQEGKAQPNTSAESHSDGDEEIVHGTVSHAGDGPGNGFDLPESVRANLGITFAKVERRRVTGTLRVPGRFETPPRAHTEYRTPLAGRIELIASQYDNVTPGTPLYRLDSPEWRALQKELLEAGATIETSFAALEMARDRADDLKELITLWSDRITALEKLHDAGGGRASPLASS